jgi:hypothetical protein
MSQLTRLLKRGLTLIGVVLMAANCDPQPGAVARPVAEAEAASQPKIDARDQYSFVDDVMTALRSDLEEDPNAYDRVAQSWDGKRYRWELAYVPLLCPSADRCVMAPFDHARFDKRVMQGWLPRIQLDRATHAALAAKCSDKKRCIVTVEGRMKLTLSSDQPTSVTFEQARVEAARAAAVDESWIVARR